MEVRWRREGGKEPCVCFESSYPHGEGKSKRRDASPRPLPDPSLLLLLLSIPPLLSLPLPPKPPLKKMQSFLQRPLLSLFPPPPLSSPSSSLSAVIGTLLLLLLLLPAPLLHRLSPVLSRVVIAFCAQKEPSSLEGGNGRSGGRGISARWLGFPAFSRAEFL